MRQFGIGETKTQIQNLLTADERKLTLRRGIVAQPKEYALNNARKVLLEIIANTNATSYDIYLTSRDKSNFRYEVATSQPYKANRGKKPKWYQEIREYLIKYWGAQVVYGAEADDVLADQQTQDTCIASIDKDLLQVPGWHYNIKNKELYHVSQQEASLNYHQQILFGDKVDTIPGLKGLLFKPRVGPKTIAKELNKVLFKLGKLSTDTITEDLYISCGKWFKEPVTIVEFTQLFKEQARLVRLGHCKYELQTVDN